MSDPDNTRDHTHTNGSSCAGDAPLRLQESASAPKDTAHARVVVCPYCRSHDVALLAQFGAQLLTDQYYCNACHTPFEHVRDE